MKPQIKTVIYNTDAHNMQVLLGNYLGPSVALMGDYRDSHNCLSDYAKDIYRLLDLTNVNQFTRLPELLSTKWKFINFINDSSIEVANPIANNYLEMLAHHMPITSKEIDIMIDLLKFHSVVVPPTMSENDLLDHWFDFTQVLSQCHYTQINTMEYSPYAAWLISIMDSQSTNIVTVLPKLEYIFILRRRIMRKLNISDLHGFEHLSFLTYGGDLKADNIHEFFNLLAQHYDQCEAIITNGYCIVNIRGVNTTVAVDNDDEAALNLGKNNGQSETKPDIGKADGLMFGGWTSTATDGSSDVNKLNQVDETNPLEYKDSKEPMEEGPVMMMVKPLLSKKKYRLIIEDILNELQTKAMYAIITVSYLEKQTIEAFISEYYNTVVNKKKALAVFSEKLTNYRNAFHSRYPDLMNLNVQELERVYGFSRYQTPLQYVLPQQPTWQNVPSYRYDRPSATFFNQPPQAFRRSPNFNDGSIPSHWTEPRFSPEFNRSQQRPMGFNQLHPNTSNTPLKNKYTLHLSMLDDSGIPINEVDLNDLQLLKQRAIETIQSTGGDNTICNSLINILRLSEPADAESIKVILMVVLALQAHADNYISRIQPSTWR